MSDQEKNSLSNVDDLEVEPLSDQDLESASGGCSCTHTTSACSAQISRDTAEFV